jgi:hypothetical protein
MTRRKPAKPKEPEGWKIYMQTGPSDQGPDYRTRQASVHLDGWFVAMLNGGSMRVGAPENGQFDALIRIWCIGLGLPDLTEPKPEPEEPDA